MGGLFVITQNVSIRQQLSNSNFHILQPCFNITGGRFAQTSLADSWPKRSPQDRAASAAACRTIRRTRWRKQRCHGQTSSPCWTGIKHPDALKITLKPQISSCEGNSTAEKMGIWMVRSIWQRQNLDDVWQLFLNTPEASMSILENQGPLQLECEASAHADLQIP